MRIFLLGLAFVWLAAGQDAPVAVFGTTVVIPSGLRGDIYYLPSDTQSLERLARLKAQGSIYTTSLNVPPQSFLSGFPGITKRFEWFAIDYSGKFWIEKPGLYRFRLVSDDGAMLYIDGQLIVDNDGVHSTEVRLGSVRLAGGMRIFSTDEFKPPVNPEDWRFPVAAELLVADADLARTAPERLPDPDDGKKKKKKK